MLGPGSISSAFLAWLGSPISRHNVFAWVPQNTHATTANPSLFLSVECPRTPIIGLAKLKRATENPGLGAGTQKREYRSKSLGSFF